MAEERHPPQPGRFVTPDLQAVELAVDRFTFPISKRDMLDRIGDDESVLIDGRNVELRTLVRDIHDDFFETEDEFREAVSVEHARLTSHLEGDEGAPTDAYAPQTDLASNVEGPWPEGGVAEVDRREP